ncbi:UNVERIFIED_CONTAM: hypothetical protein Q9R58_25455 [Methylobacteriaceae bacterium AG10]|nr:hypothetical protein [Methylobacteriaceae bacterium AG10]
MPTEIQPCRSRRLSCRQAAALTGLLVRVRILNWRMTRASARLSDREDAADSATLLADAHEWGRLHLRIAALFDMPVSENVAELRDLFGEPGASTTAKPPSAAHPDRAAAVLPK